MSKFNFDNLKEKASDIAQSSVAVTCQTAEMAKLRLAIVSEEDAIKKSYQELGAIYYQQQGNTPDVPYIPACQRVKEAQEKIQAHKKRIQELRNPDILSTSDLPENVVPIHSDDTTV